MLELVLFCRVEIETVGFEVEYRIGLYLTVEMSRLFVSHGGERLNISDTAESDRRPRLGLSEAERKSLESSSSAP